MHIESLFTQFAALLCPGPVSIAALRSALSDYRPTAREGLGGDNPWVTPGEELLIPMRPEVNGWVVVDCVPQPWVDDWDDEERHPLAFEAGAGGFFGPQTAPGALARALEQPWGWPEGEGAVTTHRAVVRLRVTYAIGQVDAERPEDRDALSELHFLTGLAQRLGRAVGALALFLPAAESLRGLDQVSEALDLLHREQFLPLDIWVNTRLYHLEDLPEHALMDCVGMGQFDQPDVEALFPREAFELDDIDLLVRQVCALTLSDGAPPAAGASLPGPRGTRWVVMGGKHPLAAPERPFVRLVTDEDVELVLRAEFFASDR